MFCDAGQRSHLRSILARCRGWRCRTQTRPDGHDSTDSLESKVRLRTLTLAQVEVRLFDVTACGWMSRWPSLDPADPARNCKLSCRTSGMWAANQVYFTITVPHLLLSLDLARDKKIFSKHKRSILKSI